ncbi:MAG: NAD(P)-dependent oxidoreductase [Prosthecobacter sp.]|nr:NAD(P)-dependent oxidoreductase [Prosthecobacter sp.]
MSYPTTKSRLGIIGLGLMGQAMAKRFLAAGFEVLGWDLETAGREALAEKGGRAAGSVEEVFAECERVVLSLPDSKVVRKVLKQAIGLRRGQVIIDTSTGDPEDAVAMAEELATQGLPYLDATVSGSSAQVEAGTVTIMVGGDTEAVIGCQEVFACLGPTVFHVGAAGSGARMKLVTNLVLGLNRAALAEGLTLARVLGLDLTLALRVLQGSMAYSRIMDTKGAKMIAEDFTPQAKLTQHLKDVRLMIEAAAVANMKLPLSETHRALLERAETMGYGDLDNSAVIRAFW